MVWLRVPYILLQQRYTGGQNQNTQSHGQQNFPSHFHELVKAITRERATIPDIEIHEAGYFRREPENVLNSKTDRGHEQKEANQSENNAKAREPDGLDAEQRMLRHADRVEETDRGEKKERGTG